MKRLQMALLALALALAIVPLARADFYTEQFTGSGDSFDLDYHRLTFTPTGNSSLTDFYTVTLDDITQFATDTSGGSVVNFGDDDSKQITLTGHTVQLFDKTYSSFYLGSNGYITFDDRDTGYTESLDWHFDRVRVSCIFDDFGASGAYPGTVSWKINELDDRVAFTYDDVEEYGEGGSNTFQIEMFFDGRIAFSYLGIDSTDSIVGLSNGADIPEDFVESNFSGAPASVPLPGSLLLCGIGLLSMGARRQLKRRNR